MPKPHASEDHADAVLAFLQDRGASHVRTRKRGAVVTVESGPSRDPIPHARFRRDTVSLWLLEMPTHQGRWQATGIRGPLTDLLETLVRDFPWTLADVTSGNPERTSDPEY